MAKSRIPNLDAMTDDIQKKYGILVNYKHVGELLGLASPTAINRWIADHDLMPAGRRGYYYSRDIARALVANGGVL